MPVRYLSDEEATAGQLRAFATIVLGMIDIPAGSTKETVISLMSPIFKGKTITLFEEGAATTADGSRPRTEKIVNGRTYVLLTLLRQNKAGGNEPLFVAVNGRGMFVPRGSAVWVPEEYVEVLDHAEEWVYPEYDAGRNMLGGLEKPTIQHAYPFILN
jgi:hypothetical protein